MHVPAASCFSPHQPDRTDLGGSPGDIRTFKKGTGNAVVLALGVWADKDKTGWIRIDLTRPRDFHTMVTNDPDSERFHRTLFRDLQTSAHRGELRAVR